MYRDAESMRHGPSEGGPYGISFASDAYETFQGLLAKMAGYGVTVTTQDGETFSGVLAGPDLDAEMGDTVRVYEIPEGEDYLTLEAYEKSGEQPRSVRVYEVYIH